MTQITHSPIFAVHAPKYFAAGFSVIPLYEREKRPVINEWSRFAENKVEQSTFDAWMQNFPNGNMGMVLGKQSGLIMIDIDTDDPVIIKAIMACLPFSPWHRLGRKGMMLAYKYTPIKTHRLKNLSGQTIVECLSSRTQCVMPPSIHPDTQLPYTANSDLLEVYSQLNTLPDNIEEILRKAVTEAGVTLSHSGWSKVTEYVAAGSRDTTLTEMAGLFAFAVVRGERTLREAIGMLQGYHAEYIENTSGDVTDVDKHIQNLIKFLHRDVLDKGKILPKCWDAGYTKEELVNMGVSLSDEETEWDFDQIRLYLQDEFEKFSDGKARSDAVERILAKVARSNQLTKIDEDRILKYVVDVSGMGIPIGTFRARLRELRSGDVKGTDHSEIARAVLADLEQYNFVRFHADNFMKWAGSHWVELDRNTIRGQISANYGHLEACRKAGDINGVLNVLSFICQSGIRTREVKGVNFANGFLTEELVLVPHDPEYGMTYTLPFRYAPGDAGRFPLFGEFLHRSWGRDNDCREKMDALQELMAVTLFGLGSRFQRAALLHGAPKSGKTQLLRIVESLVPNEAKCAVSPDQWNDKFQPAQMSGKILNICGELSEKRPIDGQKFKDIIDGSQQSAQHKSQQIFQFKPTLTHWFASNHIPKTGDSSSGFIRRWLMLTFHYPIKDSEIQLDIGDRIAAEEREAIVAWACQAMPRLKESNNYTIPHSHKLLAEEFANTNNSVRYFLRESGKVKFGVEKAQTTELKLYNSYFSFCLGVGAQKPVAAPQFRAMIRELQIEMDFTLRVTQVPGGGTEAILDRLSLIHA